MCTLKIHFIVKKILRYSEKDAQVACPKAIHYNSLRLHMQLHHCICKLHEGNWGHYQNHWCNWEPHPLNVQDLCYALRRYFPWKPMHCRKSAMSSGSVSVEIWGILSSCLFHFHMPWVAPLIIFLKDKHKERSQKDIYDSF